MKIATCSANLALPALIAAGLLAVPPEKSQAQAPPEERENYALITNTNGVTWKREIDQFGALWFDGADDWRLISAERLKIAEIVVPEHAQLITISVKDCVNLTNIVLQPATVKEIEHFDARGFLIDLGDPHLDIYAYNSGLRYITRRETMDVQVDFGTVLYGNIYIKIRRPIQWTVLEKLPKMEIRTHSTDNGPEVEIVWREGNLQIADAISGEWRDHIGASPLRIPLRVPLWLDAKPQQFFRIRRSR